MSTINLSDDNSIVGEIQELSPREKAQQTMTYCVLGGASIIFLLSGTAYIYADGSSIDMISDIMTLCENAVTKEMSESCGKWRGNNDVNTAAEKVFEFCKNFLPPIVTLVLGAHYVTKNNNES